MTPPRRGVLHTLAVDLTTAAVWQPFSEHGIEAILLKGPSISRWLYADEHLRDYADTDLLIHPNQFSAAVRLLRSAGAEPTAAKVPDVDPRAAIEVSLRHPTTGVAIDLHRTIAGLESDAEAVWTRWSSGATTMLVGGRDVLVPDEACRLLHICLHAAIDQGASARTARDLHVALQTRTFGEWEAAADVARELGGEQVMRVGLELEPEGRELAEKLGLPRATSVAAHLLRRGLPNEAVAGQFLTSNAPSTAKIAWLHRRWAAPREDVRRWAAARGVQGTIPAYASWWWQGFRRLTRLLWALASRAVRGRSDR